MANRNPNIHGDMEPVQVRTGDRWREKTINQEMEDGTLLTWEDPDNSLSDNNDYKDQLPMSPVVRRST